LLATPIAQSFSTPGYPNDYPDNLDCMWIIRSRDFTRVQLNISSGETEDVHDFVQVGLLCLRTSKRHLFIAVGDRMFRGGKILILPKSDQICPNLSLLPKFGLNFTQI